MSQQDQQPMILRKSHVGLVANTHKQKPDVMAKKSDDEDPKKLENISLATSRAIISARVALNMTQKQLADKCSMKPAEVAKYEAGQVVPKTADLVAMSRALGVVLKKRMSG
jgi:ribosome-binding protein aMBF1 (putative translation factor)